MAKKSFFLKGSATLSVMLLVVIIGSLMLVGGDLFPKVKNTQTPEEVILDPSISFPQGKKSIQLETLKFKKCSEITAAEFLLDNSGSMAYQNKISDLKSAVNSFVGKLGDSSVVAVRNFSTSSYLAVPFGFLRNNKPQVQRTISSMMPYGGTYTRDAFSQTKNEMSSAVKDERFKKYNFNLIFFSDGIPESAETNNACPGGIGSEWCTNSPQLPGLCRCFDQNEDPTNASLGNIATQIKDLKGGTGKNVRIFSIVLFDPQTDSHFDAKLHNMMKNIASPDSYYTTTNPKDLNYIFNQILQKTCE